MDILTDYNNVIKHICKIVGFEDNGNVLIIENGGKIAIPPDSINGKYNVEQILEGVVKEKYCYTEEKGFYKNENYVEPYSEEKEMQDLKEQVKTLTKEKEDLAEQITEIQLAMIEMSELSESEV